jgi:hypothetical protein
MARKPRALISLALFIAIAAGVPLLERWYKCLQPISEACVWAKAYLPLSFGLWSVAGLIAAVAAWHLLRGRTER